MTLPKYIPRESDKITDADNWIRAVTAAIDGGVSPTKTFRWNSAAQNPTVTLPTTTKAPAGMVVLAAKLITGVSTTISGCTLTWSWTPSGSGGAILVSAISGLTAATDYDVTIWIVGG